MLPDCEFLCIPEWDEGLYQEALSWVGKGRRVAILSDEERVSKDPRVQIYCLESPLQKGMIARKIGWSAVMKKMHVMGEGSFSEELKQCQMAATAILSEAADYWIGPMQNARANRSFYRRGMELQGSFQGIPAVIVGAGPSLAANGCLLREFEDKALIFAGGTAINCIDIEPHFAASIDAKAPYHQFKMHPYAEVPFCYQSRMNRDNFSLLHGEKILFPDSACEAINWIHGEERFEGGWTVGNFLTQIAILMGCSPIFFLGMDLCYEKGRKYAKIDAFPSDSLVAVGDVLTQTDWLLSARWIEERSGKDFFDLSQGILKVPKVSIEEALQMCGGRKDLKRIVHAAIQRLSFQRAERWEFWDASLQRCKEDLGEIEDEIVAQKLLNPLWQIWRPLFEGDNQNLELHQKLFFQKVLEEHVTFVLSKR